MERWIALLIGVVAVVLGALWLRGAPPPAISPGVLVVEIRDFYFDPPGLALRPGDRVIWILKENAHGDGHTVTAYHPSQDRPLRIPSGAAPWNSKLLTEIGSSFAQTFSVPGIYDYLCAPHEQQGMVGRIVVGEEVVSIIEERGLPAAALSALPTMAELRGAVGEAFNAMGLLQGILYLAQQGQTAAARSQLQSLQRLAQAGRGLATALRQRGIQAQLESRLAALEILLSRGAPLTALEPTAAQIKTLLGTLTQGG